MLARAYRWSKSNPQYNVGHGTLIEEIDGLVSAHRGLYLAGAAYRGSGIPDCIQSGVDTAAKIEKIERLQSAAASSTTTAAPVPLAT
jgi:oxygen-dependent protoporphyrinogen oxidase